MPILQGNPRQGGASSSSSSSASLPDLNYKKIAIYVGFWSIGSRIAWRYDLGPIYILGTVLVCMFMNLGKRKEGELSAYSIFNEGAERLPGDGLGEQMDAQLRRGGW